MTPRDGEPKKESLEEMRIDKKKTEKGGCEEDDRGSSLKVIWTYVCYQKANLVFFSKICKCSRIVLKTLNTGTTEKITRKGDTEPDRKSV
uniref:Uncharacterized protein n=1 Tax=Caenorhabditis tropicalis TaxID=1561998 RepID=A0A1I7TZ97_9PELO